MKECPVCHVCFGDHMQICDNDQTILIEVLPGLPVISEKYRLDRKIGIGTVGMVFQATVIQTGLVVAVKVVSPILLNVDPSLVDRFLSLIKGFAALDHVNIIKIIDCGYFNSALLYFVMDYFPGTNLANILIEEKQLSIEKTLLIMSKVCEAVANANRSGIYHLDLKPSNILVREGDDGQLIVKVTDFGIARLKTTTLITKLSPSQRDLVLGKPYYSAPEIFNSNEQIDARSEVYSIGAVLYHLLTGKPPFTGGSYPMLKMQHMGVTPNPLKEFRPDIPPTLESIIIKALEKRTTQRHSSVIALAIQLSAQLAKHREFLASQPSSTLPTLPSPPEPFYSDDPTPVPITGRAFSLQNNQETVSALLPMSNSDNSRTEPMISAEISISDLINDMDKNTLPALPDLPEPFYSNDPTPPPMAGKNITSVMTMDKDTLPKLPEPSEPFYSNNPTLQPLISKNTAPVTEMDKDTLSKLPDPETFYDDDPTPVPLSSQAFSLIDEMAKDTIPVIPTDSKRYPVVKSLESVEVVEKELSLTDELDRAFPSVSFTEESFDDPTPNPNTDTIYSNAQFSFSEKQKIIALSTSSTSQTSIDTSAWFNNESEVVITKPLVSESFAIEAIGQQEPDYIENREAERVQIIEQMSVGQENSSIENFSISEFLKFPTTTNNKAPAQVTELSPACIVYLFVEQFLPSVLSGQRSRKMHNNFATERERLAAMLLTVALFSLSSRRAIEIIVGSNTQKKQIALNNRNDGLIIKALNLDLPPLDILECKITDSLKRTNSTRFYNIFLHIAQTSVASTEKEAICEIVADSIADELTVRKLLQSKRRSRMLESGESAIDYELASDLTPYQNQANAITNWIQVLQRQATLELSGKPVQPFIYILKYYTDLFRHNSKELSKT
jgi:eukaryotic-like serine/threonine-protein kinase